MTTAKNAEPKKQEPFEGNLYDWLNAKKKKSDWQSIAKMMIDNGIIDSIADYTGVKSQNDALLDKLMGGADHGEEEGQGRVQVAAE